MSDTETIRDAGKLIRELREKNDRLRAENARLRGASEPICYSPGLKSIIERASKVRR